MNILPEIPRRSLLFRRILPRMCLLICMLLLFPTFFIGCGKKEPSMSEYVSSALDAELRVTVDGISYLVSMHLGAASADGTRDATLTVLLPEALKGMTFTVEDGNASFSHVGIDVPYPGVAEEGLFSLISLFAPCTVIARETATFCETPCVMLRTADRRRFYILPSSGTLLAVESDTVRATVEWIERRRAEDS